MLNTCSNCGNPICSDCGNHVSPGAVGAPTFQRATQFAPVQQAGFVKFPIVTWDSQMPGKNETYAHYYRTLVWAYTSKLFLQRAGYHWDKNVQWVELLLRGFATPAVLFAWVGSPTTDEHVGQALASWIVGEDLMTMAPGAGFSYVR